jgi:hypothetical protein
VHLWRIQACFRQVVKPRFGLVWVRRLRFTFHAVVWTLVSKPQDAFAAGDKMRQFLLR